MTRLFRFIGSLGATYFFIVNLVAYIVFDKNEGRWINLVMYIAVFISEPFTAGNY